MGLLDRVLLIQLDRQGGEGACSFALLPMPEGDGLGSRGAHQTEARDLGPEPAELVLHRAFVAHIKTHTLGALQPGGKAQAAEVLQLCRSAVLKDLLQP